MARRRKVRFSGRFYLTMLVLLGIVVALVLIIPSGGGGTLRNATMEAKLMPETVIIRNESTVAVDKFDMVDHLVDEGASVNAEVPVATGIQQRACPVPRYNTAEDIRKAAFDIGRNRVHRAYLGKRSDSRA